MMIIVRWKVLSWKDKPQGELNIHQLRDNIRRHQFVRRDDLDWASSSDERDRAYMQNVHIRDSDIHAGYAFPRESGLFHSGVLASGGAEVGVTNIRTVAPSNRESIWQDRGGSYSPPRNTGGRWSRENTNPKMRESRGRTRHTLGRENEVPRIVQRR